MGKGRRYIKKSADGRFFLHIEKPEYQIDLDKKTKLWTSSDYLFSEALKEDLENTKNTLDVLIRWNEIQQNFEAAKKIFKAKGIRFSHVKEEVNNHSMGYARQTLNFATENGIGLIATPSEVVDNGFLMMKSDKEMLLTNNQGVPVLACG